MHVLSQKLCKDKDEKGAGKAKPNGPGSVHRLANKGDHL